MDAYLTLSKTDDETDSVLAELCRFSVRTTGSFAAYAAFSAETIADLRDLTERVGAVSPGGIEVLVSVEESRDMTPMAGNIPVNCINPATGQIDYNCIGSAEPSWGLKATYFAMAQVHVWRGDREGVREQLAMTGGVTAIGRMADPNLLLVEFGATDCELLAQAVDDAAAIREVARLRAAFAVRPLDVEPAVID